MFGFSQKLAAVAAGSLMAVAAVGTPAEAVTSFSFDVELTAPIDGADVFSGTFSFEETAGFVDGDVEIFDLVSFDFDFLGTSFDVGSDSRLAALGQGATVAFDGLSGDILGLDFLADSFLTSTFLSIVPEDLVGDVQDSEFEYADATVGFVSGDVSYAPVPEPATVIGLIALGAGSLLVRKQQQA